MGGFPQPNGERGSLKWIQRAVNRSPQVLNDLIQPKLPGRPAISWRSPLARDKFAEYRDIEFLQHINAQELAAELREFWPNRGPQWDALACSDKDDILLVEAKAHVAELCSSPSDASPKSRRQIDAALDEVVRYARAAPRAPWGEVFYQLANRIAHLYFLRKHGRKAWLVLVNFVGDQDINGPRSPEEWCAAYQVVWHVMGLSKRHPLTKYMIDIYPDVSAVSDRDA